MFKSKLYSVAILFFIMFNPIAYSSPLKSQPTSISKFQTGDTYLYVRIIECKGGDTGNASMILIDRGDNEIIKIELEKFNKKFFESNFKIISKTLNDIKKEGYKLISSSSGGGDDNGMILQNYIFEKE